MIIDPDRPENNISGGTQNIGTICECFAEAYNVLQTTLTAFENNPSSVKSFLERILGNNYTAYEDQRDILYELYYGTKRGVSDLAKEHVESTLLSNSNAKLYTEQRLDDLAEEVTNSARSDDLDTTPRKKRKPKELAKKELANPPSSSNLETTSKGPRKANKHERRAARMKTLRPEIAHRIPDSITLHKALKIGGYTDGTEFAKDMADRAANIAEQEKGT